MSKTSEKLFANMRRLVVQAVALMLLLSTIGCQKNEEFILLTVSAELNYLIQPGENPTEFIVDRQMVVSEHGSTAEQKLELNAIKGFTYEKGYEYLLKVETVNHNETRFSLIEIVSKTKKFDEETVLLNVSIDWYPYGPGGELIERLAITEVGAPVWQPGDIIGCTFIIEGFEPEHGFNYLIKVSKNIIHLSPQYGVRCLNLCSFIELISQTSKTD
ncbi:MAG: DUF4377 domain-containing protein [Dysgonamonadaceae bacterium]|jgi:hypothetical protein|nr:DUF4377 domain-containing protein [Dysgonamonadaceae bacterium]